MNKNEFFKEMQDYFKPINDVITTRVARWFEENNVKEDDLQELFDISTEHHKYKSFPGLLEFKEFVKILRGRTRVKDGGAVSQYLQDKKDQYAKVMSAPILKVVDWLEKAKKSREYNPLAIQLLHDWDDLLTEYREAKRQKLGDYDLSQHLLKVRSGLVCGEGYVRLESEKRKVNDVKLKKM